MSESATDFEMLEKQLAALGPDERILVASAFRWRRQWRACARV